MRTPNDPEAIIGNNAHAAGWGERALGLGKCGPGYLPQYYNVDPDRYRDARRVSRTLVGKDGLEYVNPEANVEKCAPAVHNLGRMPVGGRDVRVNTKIRTFASQRRAKRRKTRR